MSDEISLVVKSHSDDTVFTDNHCMMFDGDETIVSRLLNFPEKSIEKLNTIDEIIEATRMEIGIEPA